MYKALTALLFVVFWVTGCASVRLLDTQVSSYAPHTVAAGSQYQFERLPSQQVNPTAQTQLESWAQQALTQIGLKRSKTAALRVQVSAMQRQDTAVQRPGLPMHWGLSAGPAPTRSGVVVPLRGVRFARFPEPPNYWRQVSLIMRDGTGAVVFESHASHEGPWADSQAILPALFQAALQGFPNPPEG
ncbi:MAG: hypothetical protein AUJ20_06060 [Comamonadaceae bacterium CG1_02_60_18]|nr:MAG: hypothetical protein AUJ20_06060 [Comamonadaceae bacterium CG1_02_60_18]